MKKNYQGVKLAGIGWRVNPFILWDWWKGAVKSVKISGRQDSNLRLLGPKPSALPS